MQNTYSFFVVLTIAVSFFLPSVAYVYATGEVPTFTTKVGEPKKIVFNLAKNLGEPQPYVYIIQIKNEEGVGIQLSWVMGILQTDQEIRPEQSWIPEKPGEYTVEVFVWGSLDNPTHLSPVLTMKVIVEE